jgi:hypothetical protein
MEVLMRVVPLAIAILIQLASPAAAQTINCDLRQYRAADGLRAAVEQATLVLNWTGDKGTEMRARFAVEQGQPLIRELAVRRGGAEWGVVGRNLKPEYEVTTARRRIDELRLKALRDLGQEITPESTEREKWVVSWDAPLSIPGVPSGHLGQFPGADEIRARWIGLPRKADEIQRATATYKVTACDVKTTGARLEVTFDGLSMGTFSGRLQYTVFRGTNLIRQEAIAKTDDPSVAYKYAGGLSGFATQTQRIKWRDTGGDWQVYEFGGTPNNAGVPLRARNRVAIVEGESGSVAVFPPPHKFFFSRQVEINLGYVWYRKNDPGTFAVGVRHGDRDEPFRVQATTVEMRTRLTRTAEQFADANFALYNAPPGTWQRMAVFFYVSPDAAVRTQEAVLAFTNADRYRPLAGYQVMMSHIHPPFSDELRDAKTLDIQAPWIPAIRARGVNIVMITDRGSSATNDTGPVRFPRLKHHYDAARRHSDLNFAIVSGEEQTTHFPDGGSGHWISYFPKPVMWSQSRTATQPFVEDDPVFGKVYHVGTDADMLELLKRENGLAWMAHQREKFDLPPPHGYLERIRDTDYFRSDYYRGGEYRGNVPVDLSETRMATHALDSMDDMNNWVVDSPLKLKTLHASADTYMKYPEDDIYPQAFVNYVKLDRVPAIDDGSALIRVLREGDFFVSSGEILLNNFSVEGGGRQRTLVAEFDWTFPLDFIEVVWGDGLKTDRQIIPATDLEAFGKKRISIPLDTTNKKWVRVAAWDSAGNGAFSQAIRLTSVPSSAAR